jgi:hypothetical protein
MGTTPGQSSIDADLVDRARRNGWKITAVQTGRPPAGYVDLAVYQPNPYPGTGPEKPKTPGEWLEQLDDWSRNYFELGPGFQPISGVSGLIIAARRACRGGRKLRQLRIMGHGSYTFFTVGHDQVWLSKLQESNGTLKPMGRELSQLKDFLDPAVSLVILDCCLCGQAEDLLKMLSGLWGGVAVRGYRDWQVWEHDAVQFGQGVYTECTETACQLGIEVMSVEKSAQN